MSWSSKLWEACIGLEVHAQLSVRSKLFSPACARSNPLSIPNSKVNPFDLAIPGTLPVVNKEAVRLGIKTALALRSEVQPFCIFERKHYFYPDLPHGFQITQQRWPIAIGGVLRVDMETSTRGLKQKTSKPSDIESHGSDQGNIRMVRVNRIQLENDSGKSIHDMSPHHTLLDFNRAGSALIEIVFEPDLRSPDEAGAAINSLLGILRHIGSCDGNMEEGSLRCDLNVSVRRKSSQSTNLPAPMGERVEVKNLNGVRKIIDAAEYEITRQIQLLENGQGPIERETRAFDSHDHRTRVLRRKEKLYDYQFFPEPDLPPLVIDQNLVEEVRSTLPELPHELRARLMQQYNLSSYDVSVILSEPGAAEYFENVAKNRDSKLVTNWLCNNLFGQLKFHSISLDQNPLSYTSFGQILDMLQSNEISDDTANKIIQLIIGKRESCEPIELIQKKGWKKITNEAHIEQICRGIVSAPENAENVKRYLKGKKNLFNFFLGLVMAETKGRFDAQKTRMILESILNEQHK